MTNPQDNTTSLTQPSAHSTNSKRTHKSHRSGGGLGSDYSDAAYEDNSVFLGDGEDDDLEGNKHKNAQEAVHEMIQEEKSEVSRIQNRFLLLLATCSVLVCIAIGVASSRMEVSSLEDSFHESSVFLFSQFQVQAAQSLHAMASLSVSLTMLLEEHDAIDARRAMTFDIILPSDEEKENQEAWFVTDPHFDTRAQMVQDLLWKGASDNSNHVVFTSPVVMPTTMDTNSSANMNDTDTVQYPIWQVSPASLEAQIANKDLHSIPTAANAIAYAIEHQAAVLSGVLTPVEQSFLGLATLDYAMEDEDAELNEPMGLFVVPIFDTVQDNDSSRVVVGTLIASFSWSDLLVDILPQDEIGVHVVFANAANDDAACGDVSDFTYILLEEVVFSGMEDLHQSYYDETEVAASLQTILQATSMQEQNDHGEDRAFVFADDYPCSQGLEIRSYESSTYRQMHKTPNPAIVTGTVVTILVVVIILVLCYASKLDYRRTRTVEKYARTQHLINSLFPKDVQERMFQEHDLGPKVLKGDAPLLQIQSTMKEKEAKNSKALPIAERFESATVMFADISGFTQWSSGREPGNVFELLETIYNAFDKVAKERGIFKVETIGDCYMCVCGLPERREDHASAMSIFAQICLRQMKKLTKELHQKLGGNTNKLTLRVGLNSGEVTAGVLRGEKSRFQLFGDTVNTASRMESTGIKNRVQISPTTADLLKAEGKEHWYTQREGGVEAKGKGQLNTYWLSPASMSAGNGTRSASSGEGEGGGGSNYSGRVRRRASRKDSSEVSNMYSQELEEEDDKSQASNEMIDFDVSRTENGTA